jgi:cytochrome c-type biogenesis protein CcmH/NrfG
VAALCVFWLVGQRFMADRQFQKGVRAYQSQAPVDQVIAYLERAHALNGKSDLYARNLSQAYLIQTLQRVAARPSPEAFGPVRDAAKLAVNMAMEARDLASANVDNWSNLGSVYVGIMSFSQGADEQATAAFEQAALLDPFNPTYPTELGRIAYLRSDAFRKGLAVNDEAKRAEAEKGLQEALFKAQEWLKKAVALKSDYFPARYHLGVVYERQNRLKEAIVELETVLTNNTKDAGVAFELAILYYRNNEKLRALNLMEQVVKALPNDANARWYLASLYEEQGKAEAALAQLRELAKQLPNQTAIQQKIEMLQQAQGGAPTVRALPEPIGTDALGTIEQKVLR